MWSHGLLFGAFYLHNAVTESLSEIVHVCKGDGKIIVHYSVMRKSDEMIEIQSAEMEGVISKALKYSGAFSIWEHSFPYLWVIFPHHFIKWSLMGAFLL